MTYSGSIDRQDGPKLSGWATNSSDPAAHLWVEVTTPTGSVICVRANQLRRSITKVAGCGFEVHLHPSDLDGTREAIVRIADTGEVLSTPEKGLKSRLKRAISSNAKPVALPAEDKRRPRVFATIGLISGNHIQVWIDNRGLDVVPMITVGNVAARQAPDVTKHAFMNRTGHAYDFYVSGLKEGEEVALWLFSEQRMALCETRRVSQPFVEHSIVKQLARAAEIAREPGAVAVTCWSGGHNPIGRAKVLFDVLEGRRPVVLFAFMFTEFGKGLWQPLNTSNVEIVTIPWAERHFYLRMARSMGMSFETVWMCKPRRPTFELAAALATPNARVILDIDDNEEVFSGGKGARTKAFGLASIGLSRFAMENIPARTAPSLSLQQDFKTHMVRHARRAGAVNKRAYTNLFRVGFIGTVRRHKRIVEAAEAIRAVNTTGDTMFEFHVYGDVWPEKVRDALVQAGAVVRGNIQMNDLQRHLATFDIILTGFPSEAEEAPITRYQISSKIGDALSVGLPALVPSTAAVADLADVPGVFLFNTQTFADQLFAAAQSTGDEIELPKDFTLDGAFDAFLAAEKQARGAQSAGDALAHIPAMEANGDTRQTLLLLWKQHDTALYGRRPDVLARTYAEAFADHRVVVLEILGTAANARYRADDSTLSEIAYLRELNTRKSKTFEENGVEYHQVRADGPSELNDALTEYFGAQKILPTNAVLVLFPHIPDLETVYDLLGAYRVVTDVVDNKLSWASENCKAVVAQQYFALGRLSDGIVFNSAQNMEGFRAQGLLNGVEDKAAVIPNWYRLPAAVDATHADRTKDRFNIFYTGNMNDRIDWDLLSEIAGLDERVRLHLVGEARRSFEQVAELLETHPNVIFHGVKNERMTLKMLGQADLAVVPHLVDKFSAFMNPMKVHMYAALGVPAISSNVPGVEATDLLIIAASREAFLDQVRLQIERGSVPHTPMVAASDHADRYLDLLSKLQPNKI